MTGGGKIFAFRYNGVLLTEFPVLIERGFEQQSYPDPILADIDGDGTVEIIVGSMNNRILAYNYLGKLVPDFPLSISAPPAISLTITNLNQNEKYSLIARSNDDYCYVWTLNQNYDRENIFWGEYFTNFNREPVNIYGSCDQGQTWKVVYTFSKGKINHIHSIIYDRFREGYWVLTGDREDECNIFFTNDEFKNLLPVIKGGQRASAMCGYQ